VLGEVTGNVTARDKVDIRDNGSVTATSARRVWRLPRARMFRGASSCSEKAPPRAGEGEAGDSRRRSVAGRGRLRSASA